jgi:hypothetical protein
VWFPTIPDLKPKYIIFYIGINDFYRFTDDPKYEVFDGRKNSLKNIIKNNSCWSISSGRSGCLKAKKWELAMKRSCFQITRNRSGIADSTW